MTNLNTRCGGRRAVALLASSAAALLSCAALAQTGPLTPAGFADLGKLYQRAHEASQQAAALRLEIEMKSAEIAAIRQSSPNLDREAQSAADDLEKLQKVERESPGVLRPDALDAARAKSEAAANRRKDAQARLSQDIASFDEDNRALAKKAVEEDHAKAAYLSRFEELADGVLTARINDYKKPQDVTESASAACGNLSVADCKAKAMQEAERKAIERGSVIVVDSITEINNLTLTKDKARSEVRGTISNREILESKLIADDTAAYASIKATVMPGITDALRDEILQSVRADMSAQVGDEGMAPRLIRERAAAHSSIDVNAAATVAQNGADPQTPASLEVLRNIYNRRDERRTISLSAVNATTKIGDEIELVLTSSHPGYLYVLMLGSDGNAFDMIFPNKIDGANTVRGGDTIHLPRSSWQLLAQGPAGKDHLLAIVSDAPRDFSKVGLNPSGPFSSVEYSNATATDIQLATGLSANAIKAVCADGAKGRNLMVGAKSCSNAYGAALISLEEVK